MIIKARTVAGAALRGMAACSIPVALLLLVRCCGWCVWGTAPPGFSAPWAIHHLLIQHSQADDSVEISMGVLYIVRGGLHVLRETGSYIWQVQVLEGGMSNNMYCERISVWQLLASSSAGVCVLFEAARPVGLAASNAGAV